MLFTLLILRVEKMFVSLVLSIISAYLSLFVSAKRSCYVKTEIHITVLLCWHETNIYHVNQGKKYYDSLLKSHFSCTFLHVHYRFFISVYNDYKYSFHMPLFYIFFKIKWKYVYMAIPTSKQSVKCWDKIKVISQPACWCKSSITS